MIPLTQTSSKSLIECWDQEIQEENLCMSMIWQTLDFFVARDLIKNALLDQLGDPKLINVGTGIDLSLKSLPR